MTWRGRWTLEDRERSVYQYIPFDVAAGSTGIEVRLDYDRGAGVIDLGVFDPDGFRGYSGGARDSFAITPHRATPGYLPGDLPAGEWSVLLGLYMISADGVACEVTISTDGASVPAPPPPPPPSPGQRPPGRRIPAATGRRWVGGDLHAHSVHSDGELTLEQLADDAARRRLDFLAVTDHNTVSHHPHLAAVGERYGIQLVPGQEVTTHVGHANALGAIPWIDFRNPADAWLADTTAGGGLLSINHPVDVFMGWHHELSGPAPLAETWHKTWNRRSSAPIDWQRQHGGVPVGGSDFHNRDQGDVLGTPATFVEVEGDDVLGALAAGRVAISAEPAGPVMFRSGDELTVVDGEGMTVLAHPDERPQVVTKPIQFFAVPEAGPHRLVAPDGLTMALAP